MNISCATYPIRGLVAYGEKLLKAEHLVHWMNSPKRVDQKGISFELGRNIEEVENNFFLLLPTINKLIIKNPKCNVIMSDESIALFKKNKVLLCGEFDSTAEQMAKQYGLRFLHTNVGLGSYGDFYKPWGVTNRTLCFTNDGNAYVKHEEYSEGHGGGELTFDLPANFYESIDSEGFVDRYAEKCSEKEETKGILKIFWEKAKIRGGFFIDYSVTAGSNG